MKKKLSNIYILNEKEKEIMKGLSNKIMHIDPYKQANIFVEEAKELSKEVPDTMKAFINSFNNNEIEDDMIIFKNLPYDINLNTPESNEYFIGETTILSRCQSIINEYIGEMISYEAEAHGHLFQDMVPNKKLMSTQTSLGSKIELELHTEQAFSTLRPDFLCLSCITGDKNAKTYYLHMDNITNNLSREENILLKEKLWKIGVDLSFVMNGCCKDIRGPLSIIENNKLVFDQDLMIGTSKESKDIITKIIKIYYEHRKFHVLQPGDALIINNKKLVHGRSSFEPLFNGKDRFILRSFIMKNIDKIKDKTNTHNRMIDLRFS